MQRPTPIPPTLTTLLLLAVVLVGCQRPQMVLPLAFASGEVSALADEPAQTQRPTRSLFYATDRVCEKSGNDIHYGRERSGGLDVGRVAIRFGDQAGWPQIAAQLSGQTGGKLPRPEMRGIERYGRLSDPVMRPGTPTPEDPNASQGPGATATAFIQQLNAAVKRSPGKQITIHIHGFNVSFREAALTAAEYELITGGLGPFILYSWPSYGSVFEYSHDRDSVRFTSSHARRFVVFLAREIELGRLDAEQINFITHSSGAEIVGSVIRELGLLSHDLAPDARQRKWRIGTIAMVSPDVSADVARERLLKEDIRGVYRKIVVYSSARDRALRWASRILYRTTRIGSIREDDLTERDHAWLDERSGVSIIDVDSRPYDGWMHHTHHRYSPAVASDIVLSLRTGLTPDERGLTRNEGELLWRFGDDYPQRVTEAAQRAYRDADPAPDNTQHASPVRLECAHE